VWRIQDVAGRGNFQIHKTCARIRLFLQIRCVGSCGAYTYYLAVDSRAHNMHPYKTHRPYKHTHVRGGMEAGQLGIHRVGQNHKYKRCVYGIFGREITKPTVIYGVYIYGSGQP